MGDLRLCRTCKMVKEAGEFYASQPARCKACVCKRAADHRAANLDSVRAYDRERAKRPERMQHNTQTVAEWRAANPREYKAQNALNNALRDGKVVRWPVCAVPECHKRPVAHHPDYDRPLDVVWLCQAHHKQAHAIAEAA